MNNKVQRPDDYDFGSLLNESRSKLVGTKWFRNGEPLTTGESEDMV